MHTTQTIPVKISRGETRTQFKADTRNRNRIIKKMDAAITEKVDEVLWNDEVLRNTDYKDIDVFVEDQIVYLSGHVLSTMHYQRVQNALRAVPGIVEIKSALFSDDNLTREVAGALGHIEHVNKVKFFTGVRHGVVALNGEVDDVNLCFQAEKCASNIPGVRGVINHIRTSGIAQKTDDLRFLQPTIGQQIYFRDGPSGMVKQVIMNPNNRLVVAMIVLGRFTTSLQPFRFGGARDTSLSKMSVIPVREIRYLTKRSGFLNIKALETARYRDFDPKGYIPPKKDWDPPFPYYFEDVLFPAEYGETMPIGDEGMFFQPLETPMDTSSVRNQVIPVYSFSINNLG